MYVVDERRKNKSFKVEDSVYIQLQVLFEVNNMSMSSFIRSFLIDFLKMELKKDKTYKRFKTELEKLPIDQKKIIKGRELYD